MMIRAKTPRTIVLIACLGTAFAIGGCGGGTTTPATPVLLGVLDDSCAEIPPSTTGGFRLLPAGAVRLRVAAAWPSADLVVKANGAELEKVGPSDTQRQSDLKAAGKAYWVPVNIDPNPTPPAWTVHVERPLSMRAAPLTLELTSRTPGGNSSSPLTVEFVQDMHAEAPAWNRVQLDWRDRVDEAGYLLERSDKGGPYKQVAQLPAGTSAYTDTHEVTDEATYSYRLTAQGCPPKTPMGPTWSKSGPVDVTTPSGPKSGVETITLSRSPSAPDMFVYKNPLSIFAPRWDAVVSSVTNVAVDVNGNGVRLEYVRHTDSKGVMRSVSAPGTACPQEATGLAPQDSSPRFDGLTVAGEWTARAVCINNVFLRDHIELRIAWRAP